MGQRESWKSSQAGPAPPRAAAGLSVPIFQCPASLPPFSLAGLLALMASTCCGQAPVLRVTLGTSPGQSLGAPQERSALPPGQCISKVCSNDCQAREGLLRGSRGEEVQEPLSTRSQRRTERKTRVSILARKANLGNGENLGPTRKVRSRALRPEIQGP